MKILLTITICLQLLQGEDAAKFDEKRENNEQEKKWKSHQMNLSSMMM